MLGASFDTVQDNKAFADAEAFGFRLLSDVDKRVGTQYEVVRQGDERAEFALRIAYLIDPEGVIRKAYDVSDTAAFATEVLADLERLSHG